VYSLTLLFRSPHRSHSYGSQSVHLKHDLKAPLMTVSLIQSLCLLDKHYINIILSDKLKQHISLCISRAPFKLWWLTFITLIKINSTRRHKPNKNMKKQRLCGFESHLQFVLLISVWKQTVFLEL